MPREYLAGLLWSDRGEIQARSSLRQALVALRRDLSALGDGFLLVKETNIALKPGLVEIDAVEFQRLAQSNDLATLRRAALAYQGELLADIYIADPVYNEWLVSERRRLADIATNVLEKLCARETGQAQIEVARRIVALDPLRETPHRVLMQFYQEAGETGLALRQYEICRRTLESELQVAPSEETESLYRQLKNSVNGAKPIQIGAEITGSRPEGARVAGDKPIVLVLPFENAGDDAEVDRFCDGLTEDVTVGLSRISTIRVIAHVATFSHRRRPIDIVSAARLRGARYILDGSVRTAGKITRATVQLIDADGGHHIWAQQMNRPETDVIFDLQDDLTRSIVASVQTQIILSEGRHRSSVDGADSLPGLLARSWQRFLALTDESLGECRVLAERALTLDGRNGAAHRMRAAALYHQVYMGFIPWVEPTIEEIYKHGKASVESDEADEYSHWVMECAHLLKKEHEPAMASLRRALEINPNCSLAIGSMGTVLAWSGQPDESVRSNELALHMNPQDPSNFFRHFGLALAHYLASRYSKAVAHARMVVQTRPGWRLANLVYAASLMQSQRPDEAVRILSALQPLDVRGLNYLPFARSEDLEHLRRGLEATER